MWVSVFGVLLGGRAVIALVPDPQLGLAATVAISLFDIAVLIWQVTGTTRAALRSMGASSDAFPAWGALAMVCVALFMAAIGILDWVAALPPVTVEPPVADEPLPVIDGEVTVSGEIDYAIFRRLQASLAGDPRPDTLVLTSDGGLVYAARAIARLVAEHGLSTRAERRCASACVLIFLAGEPRALAPGAELGFHGYVELGNVPILDIPAEEARDRASFLAEGIDRAFIEKVFATPPDRMWFPTLAELVAAGVVSAPAP